MRVVSFAVTASALLMTVKASECNYADLTEEIEKAYLNCIGTETSLTACDPQYQDQLEKAVASNLYDDSPQCNCVYYNEEIAFNWISRNGCHKMRPVSENGRCWTSQHKLFYTTGALTEALNEICTSLPAPSPEPTEEPVDEDDNECLDDPDGSLASLPIECPMAVLMSGGCQGELHFMLKKLWPEATISSLCPATCEAHCQTASTTAEPETPFEPSLDCQDDPRNILGELQASCVMMVEDPTIGCEDPFGVVPPATGGYTTAELCPASCDARCAASQ